MLLRTIQRAAVIEDLLRKIVGARNVTGLTGNLSITVDVDLIREAQEQLNRGSRGEKPKGSQDDQA